MHLLLHTSCHMCHSKISLQRVQVTSLHMRHSHARLSTLMM